MTSTLPSQLKAPFITVDEAAIRKVDPRNAGMLYGMWTGKIYVSSPFKVDLVSIMGWPHMVLFSIRLGLD